jgi:hypothetical protein
VERVLGSKRLGEEVNLCFAWLVIRITGKDEEARGTSVRLLPELADRCHNDKRGQRVLGPFNFVFCDLRWISAQLQPFPEIAPQVSTINTCVEKQARE